jgi:ATP-dependent exoDNAse (exonuclease V) beta subunit
MTALALTNPHVRDACIEFDPEPHVYTVHGDSGYTSVTTWLHSHFEGFDAEAVASRIVAPPGPRPGSKYVDMTKAEILTAWEKNGREASEAGTALHENIERHYNGLGVAPDVAAAADYRLFKRFLATHAGLQPYRTEWMVWNEELRLAGSIDMVFANADGSVSIYDWKRCKEIRKTSPWGTFAKTGCIEHIPDTNYWHYALQLNVYAALLEANYGKSVTELKLVVLHPSQQSHMVIGVPRLREEVRQLFEDRRTSLTQT